MPANHRASSRQKSFFEQDNHVCPYWSNNRRRDNATHQSEYIPRPPTTITPIAPSSESMSKLQAFQFQPHNVTRIVDIDGLADIAKGHSQTKKDEEENTATRLASPIHPSLSQNSTGKHTRECPQTPIGRLPLAELIADGNDLNYLGVDSGPVERVLWNHSQQSSDPSSSQGRRTARRGKKRAHSSSPSISRIESRKILSKNRPSNKVENLQPSLKTPQADPANELWNRYSLDVDRPSPTRPPEPTCPNLHSSPPPTPTTHLQNREGGKLCRSYSCNVEWPTSATKRRKIQYSSSTQEGTVGSPSYELGYEASGKSKIARVSLLVEQIQKRLVKANTQDDDNGMDPSILLPFLEKASFSTGDPASPRVSSLDAPEMIDVLDYGTALVAGQTQRLVPVNMGTPNATYIEHEQGELLSNFVGHDDNEEDGENDEDGLDCELTRSTDEADPEAASSYNPPLLHPTPNGRRKPMVRITTMTAPPHGKAAKSFPDPAALDNVQSDGFSQHEPAVYPSSVKASFHDSDEFDDDSDVFAAELEDIVAKYDTKPQSPIQKLTNKIPAGARTSTKPEPKTFGTDISFNAQRVGTGIKSGAMSDDEFGGDADFENIMAECEEASQKSHLASQSQFSNERKSLAIQRYLIMTVAEGNFDSLNGRSQPEKVLSVENEKTQLKKVIILRGSWLGSQCTRGSYINLIGEFDQHGQCVVDDTRNLLIIDPDHLISATVVADSFSCTRRAVLQDRVKATSQPSESTVYGSMLHEIFQDAMRANRWDTEWLTTTIQKVVTRYIESLFEMNVTCERAVDHLLGKAVELQAWAQVFVAARPKANAIVRDRNGATALMSVSKLLDVEEKLWSPAYGLKGMVDATVQVSMKDGDDERILTVPLEVKTGKFPNAAHKAQTALYTLLLSDRYDVEILYGILYYTETSDISRIPAVRHELIHMVMQRNELASYVRQRYALPPMLKSPHLCGKCYAQTPCFLYHKLVENGTGETSGMDDKFDDLVKHLKPIHQGFFQKWDELITKEEKDVVKLRRELWTMSSTEREKLGRCFAHVIIDLESVNEQENAPKINRFNYAFLKQKTTPGFSFTESQIAVGEPIVISDEIDHFAFASGYVTSVRKHRIHVAVDRRLHNARVRNKDFDGERNQSFTGIMEVIEDGGGEQTHIPVQSQDPVLYRIDKDEFSNGMATVRNNLIRLMENDVFGTQALRRLIVEGITPTFKPMSTPYSLADSASQASLNVDQRCAIEKVMSAKDYALVLGMPGTGKTTTIAHIIRALTAQGKSVLLTSYTHTAVDNILLKIRKDNIGVFRLGAVAKVHPEIQEFADLGGVPMKTVEEIEKSYSRQVVATTCLGVNHPIFNQRVFDYCIVDEASQITLPVCLGPIRMARTFILVGDHYQLPPLVQNKEALEGGLDISLFKMLSEQHPSSVINLEHQYRMCDDIMTLSNTLIYNGRLKCGTQAVADRTLQIPNIDALSQHHHTLQSLPPSSTNSRPTKSICVQPTRGSCWIRDLLDPSVKACLINTDPLLPSSRESESGSRIINACEATICAQLVDALITTGVPASDIGVITLYRSQLALLKQNLRHQHPAVEMHTADKFQGRDKEVVVLSLVRSNERQNVGDLLKDWRRVNVAFTRARTKLLVVGSAHTIRGNELLERFVGLMEGRGWMYGLPAGAMEGHLWDHGGAALGLGAEGEGGKGKGKGIEEVKMKEVGQMKMEDPNNNKLNQHESNSTHPRTKNKTRNENNPPFKPPRNIRKMPLKTARLDTQTLLGKRPVLRDIINDAF